jgi:hypothetical protein
MANNKRSFQVITGMWRRKKQSKAGGTEHYLYAKPRLTEPLVIYPGDELYMFDTSAKNAGPGDPCKYLKVKRAAREEASDDEDAQ